MINITLIDEVNVHVHPFIGSIFGLSVNKFKITVNLTGWILNAQESVDDQG